MTGANQRRRSRGQPHGRPDDADTGVTAPSVPGTVLDHIGPRADSIVPLANGEPVSLLDAVEGHASDLDGVRVYQMQAIHDRPYLHGAFGDRLRSRTCCEV